MAARRKNKSPQQAKTEAKTAAAAVVAKTTDAVGTTVAATHLPPLGLVVCVLICSGFLAVLALRDYWTTGKNFLGDMDEKLLIFTKSTDWYVDAKGWKDTQGGFSAVSQVTTDANNMGGFFVRKVAGAAAMGVHVTKLWPLLVHGTGMEWQRGHFVPLLTTAAVANLSLIVFYLLKWDDLRDAQATELPTIMLGVLALEAMVLLYYAATTRIVKGAAVALTQGKTEKSLPSNIATRTVLLVTTAVAIMAARDLFFPGTILPFWPRDDIYLEWTNALLHSPPPGSPEAQESGMEALLLVGDKFMGQLMALHLLLVCMFKFVASLGLRLQADGRGRFQAKLLWQGAALTNVLIVFALRLFTPAAMSASLDLRWHLMALAYETFILVMYGFF